MKKKILVCLILILSLLLSGCSVVLEELLNQFYGQDVVPYSQMEYVRPDMNVLQTTLEESCEILEKTWVLDRAIEAIDAYYIVYDDFYTAYNLANIRYSGNLTDTGWEAEYNFCAENAAAADAGLDELYRAAAKSPARTKLEEEWFGEGFFDAYEGDSFWDETFLAMMEEESQLQNAYYTLSDSALEAEYYSEEYFTKYGTQMAELLVELVALRQQIAAYAGYESYPQFAYEFYHYRDYTPEETEIYLENIGKYFVEQYRALSDVQIWELVEEYCSEKDTFTYVKKTAEAMGGTPEEAFSVLEQAGVYDIAYGENKYDSSFEAYLWSYGVPFIFMNPWMDQADKLVFAHEFGHFCNDYVCWGSYAGTDVAEVHSQAFEYLSLCYGEASEELREYKLAESLRVYMEQAAYGLFELQLYQLTGEELTVENVQALYKQIGENFGLDAWDWDFRDYVTVIHYYTHPMYIVSYVVSNDLAMQIYEMELAEPGSGLALYEEILSSQDSFLVTFAETYGLKSPFAPERLEELERLFDRYVSAWNAA